MRWSNVDEIFPLGYAELPDGRVLSNAELKDSNIATVFQTTFEQTPEGMVTAEKVYFWGDEGEFKVETIYDVYHKVPHPDPECYPLSVYGQLMLNDYLYLNNLTIE